jgi:hypothetical protein
VIIGRHHLAEYGAGDGDNASTALPIIDGKNSTTLRAQPLPPDTIQSRARELRLPGDLFDYYVAHIRMEHKASPRPISFVD